MFSISDETFGVTTESFLASSEAISWRDYLARLDMPEMDFAVTTLSDPPEFETAGCTLDLSPYVTDMEFDNNSFLGPDELKECESFLAKAPASNPSPISSANGSVLGRPGAQARGSKKGRIAKSTKLKPSCDFRPYQCPYQMANRQSCPFRGASKRDLRRHLATEKHRRRTPYLAKAKASDDNKESDSDEGQSSPPTELFVCPVTECKFFEKGFSREDNFRRHLKTQHPEHLTAKSG
jgi:hypothetical protein